MEIYKNFRHDYEWRIILPNIEDSLKTATAKYVATDLVQEREAVKDSFFNLLRDRLDDYGIIVISVSVTDFQFTAEFDEAIEKKVTAEQDALAALNKLEQIKYEAQQQVIKAEANATAILTLAHANANATVIAAEAQAQAIQIIQAQLVNNTEFLSYQAMLVWDGVLPYYWSGEGNMPFVLIPARPTNSTYP